MPWPLSADETDGQTYTPLALTAPDGMRMSRTWAANLPG